MGTQTKDPDELQTLTRAGAFKVQDVNGTSHLLSLLDMTDLAEFEKEHGGFLLDPSKLSVVLYVLWLSLRKEGKKEEELDRGEYAYTLGGCGRLFTLRLLPKINETLIPVLVASGWSEPSALGSDPQPGGPVTDSVPAGPAPESGGPS